MGGWDRATGRRHARHRRVPRAGRAHGPELPPDAVRQRRDTRQPCQRLERMYRPRSRICRGDGAKHGRRRMITVHTFGWVPPFAQGLVRDMRVRWALEEAGLAYGVRPIDADTQQSPDYRALQPFGQAPVYEEDGLSLFESGAIVLHIGEKSEALLPRDREGRARAVTWLLC